MITKRDKQKTDKQAQKQPKEHPNLRWKTVGIAVGVFALILACGFLILNLLLPMGIYHKAESAAAASQYDEAISGFTKLTERYNLNGKLAHLGGFADAEDQLLQTRYAKGVYLREQGSYAEAAAVFEELGDYSDSKDQASNTRLLQAKSLIESQDYNEAIAILEELQDYDGGDYGNASELKDKAVYERSCALVKIGKLSDAEAGFAQTESYQDSYEQLQEVRYNMARNALLTYDFETARSLFAQVGDYEDAGDLVTVLDSAVDKVYRCDYTDVTGQSTGAVTLYLWVHSVIIPGKLDEGVSVKMQQDISVGEVNASLFGSASYDYTLEQVRNGTTWYFTFYGSDTVDENGALLLEAEFSDDYQTLVTRKVYKATRDEEVARDAQDAEDAAKVAESEDDTSDEVIEQNEEGDETPESNDGNSSKNGESAGEDDEEEETSSAAEDRDADLATLTLDEERTWTEVTDEETVSSVKEGFRRRIRVQLAENGNMAFYNDTDDERLPHYCSVANCLNKGENVVSDENGRRYYCSEHQAEYESDPGYTASEADASEESAASETAAESGETTQLEEGDTAGGDDSNESGTDGTESAAE